MASNPPQPPGGIDQGPHDRGTLAVSFEMAVFQIDPSGSSDRGEFHVHFTGFGGVGFITPLVGDLPGHHKAPRGFPEKDFTPIALSPVLLFCTAAATGAAFHDRFLHG